MKKHTISEKHESKAPLTTKPAKNKEEASDQLCKTNRKPYFLIVLVLP